MHGFLPGQEYGYAVADVIFGAINPSAKLLVTLPNVENEVGFTQQQYPGVNMQADYSEKMLIGYRWYTANNITPAFPFGHGLSYTSFSYSDILASSSEVRVTVTNDGIRAGADVAQLYLAFPMHAQSPPLQLKGFAKTPILQPGESYQVFFPLTAQDISIWNANIHDWQIVEGKFGVKVGASSADIRQESFFTYQGGSSSGSTGWASLSTTEQGLVIGFSSVVGAVLLMGSFKFVNERKSRGEGRLVPDMSKQSLM